MEFDILIKVGASMLMASLVGAEREYKSKSAGFRTMILISVGATVFTYCSILIGSPNSADRIASNIATGIGFIGAGVIFKTDNKVNGLTSAATIWAVAGMGMLNAIERYGDAAMVCASILAVQFLLVWVEKLIESYNLIHTYKITCNFEHDTLKHYEKVLAEHHLRIITGKQTKTKNTIMGIWEAAGHSHDHEKFMKEILKDPKVLDFEF